MKNESGNIVKPYTHHGYHYVICGKSGRDQVHRLVLRAFKGDPPEGTVCRHLDGDRLNNHPSNLAWGSQRENCHDTIRHNGKSPNAKLSYKQAVKIRAKVKKRGDKTRIARELGLSVTLVSRIALGKTYYSNGTLGAPMPRPILPSVEMMEAAKVAILAKPMTLREWASEIGGSWYQVRYICQKLSYSGEVELGRSWRWQSCIPAATRKAAGI